MMALMAHSLDGMQFGLGSRDSSCFVDPGDAELQVSKLSPKLYHESDLQVGCQQSIAEEPRPFFFGLNWEKRLDAELAA
jgi:hypothetical protein